MRQLVTTILLMLLLAGCSLKNMQMFSGLTQKGKLSEAINAMDKGNELAATKLLEEICASENVSGVTDEALFRLSMLGLRQYKEPEGMQLVQKRMERLRTEFPTSEWTRLAWPLMEYINSVEGVRGDLRALKLRNTALSKDNRELHLTIQQLQGTNQSLTKENKEIKERIDKLKDLDVELERKNRR